MFPSSFKKLSSKCLFGRRWKSSIGQQDSSVPKEVVKQMNETMTKMNKEMNETMTQTALGLAGLTVSMGTLMIGLMIALHDVSTNNLQRQAEGFSKRIEAQDARFESQNVRFESQNDKLESQDRKIDAQDSKIEAQDMIIKSKSK